MQILISTIFILLSFNASSQAIQRGGQVGNNHKDNLSDRDRLTTQEFVHAGKSQRLHAKECQGEDIEQWVKDACLGIAADKVNSNIIKDSNMAMALSKVYSMVLGADFMSGFGSTSAQVKKAEGAEEAKEAKKKEDYCRYIPMATETLALFQQQSSNSTLTNIPANPDSAQKDALMKASRSYADRGTQAKTQAYGWGITTACYTAQLATYSLSAGLDQAYDPGWGPFLKLTASGILADFYIGQVKTNNDYKDKTLEIARKLPGKGDCNPITDLNCYCAEPQSMYDPKYCRSKIHARALKKATGQRIACVDSALKPDPKCHCLLTDDCISKDFLHKIEGTKFNQTFGSNGLRDFTNLVGGELPASILVGSKGTRSAISDRLKEFKERDFSHLDIPTLNKKQKAEAKSFEKLGFPPLVAQKLASMPATKDVKKNLGNFNGKGSLRKYRGHRPGAYKRSKGDGQKTITFGRSKRKSKGRSKNTGLNAQDFLDKLGRKKRKKSNGGSGDKSLLKFSEKAQRAAQITKNSHRPLFEIISHRYQISGRRKLEVK